MNSLKNEKIKMEVCDWGDVPVGWRRRHLLGLEDMSAGEIELILDQAERFRLILMRGASYESCNRKIPLLSGKTCVNLFFENSTRTKTSFSLAARRLGMDVVDFSASTSSLSKGETFIDTVKNLEAMQVDVIVVRHSCPGTAMLLSENIRGHVLNAGDGAHEHPTQALLDILTIRQRFGKVAGLTVALVGDIAHSRTARSNIWGLRALGANVILCGPSTLVSRQWEALGVKVSYSLDAILDQVDVFNLLRIQFERQVIRPFPSTREYAHLYGMDAARLAKAKTDVLIIAPGPINRGLEVTPDVADGQHSAILDQVTNGVAIRMATLWMCINVKPEN
ncbi:MAG: aspartate carbamoyltransferase catalytic subunit [Planctomycetaceae bacterium]|nr:aspartate carbamoyltransferase catalytic subunit [Planctomycetaceae bacterium]